MSTVFRPSESARAGSVILAEDDDDCRIALSKTLEREGYSVVALASGAALLAHLHSLRGTRVQPSVIIADQRMPGMTGTHVLERMQEWRLRIPLVLITGFDDPVVLDRAQAMGAAVLCKPLDGDDLCKLVRHCFERPHRLKLKCASCGSQLNLHGLDEGGEVFFCRDCQLRGEPDDGSIDLLTDLGGGD